MLLRLLFIGDIVGEPGRKAVRASVPGLRESLGLHGVVANGENSAGGKGITPGIAKELFAAGVDAITCGDHLYDAKEVSELLANEPRFVRPLNLPAETPGNGSTIVQLPCGVPLAVMNLQGRVFMPPNDCPFAVARREAERLRATTPVIFVDFHAEATSEKIAMGWWLAGKVSAVIGTHTHVQTADEQILPGGTAYLTDAGFTGGHASVIGREVEPVLRRFVTGMPQRFDVARGDVRLKGAVVEIESATGQAVAIRRVAEALPAG